MGLSRGGLFAAGSISDRSDPWEERIIYQLGLSAVSFVALVRVALLLLGSFLGVAVGRLRGVLWVAG